MKKIGLIFDSSCGYSKSKIEADGNNFVPIRIEILGEVYLSGIDIDNEKLNKKFIEVKEPFKTSAIILSELEDAIEKGLKEYEHLIYIPISRNISSTNDNAKHFVENNDKYKDKVTVIESHFLTPWIQIMYDDLMEMISDERATLENVLSFINFRNNDQKGYVAPDSLERLKIGGRLSEVQYKMSALLKIVPIIEVINGSLTDGRTFKVRKKERIIPKMLSLVKEDIERLKENDPQVKYKILYLMHNNHEMMKILEEEIQKTDLTISGEVVLSPEINAHVGARVFGIGAIIDKHWSEFIK